MIPHNPLFQVKASFWFETFYVNLQIFTVHFRTFPTEAMGSDRNVLAVFFYAPYPVTHLKPLNLKKPVGGFIVPSRP